MADPAHASRQFVTSPMNTLHGNATLGRLRGALWIIGFSSLGVTEGHRWITGVLLLGALAFAALVSESADPKAAHDHEEPAELRRGSPRRSENAPLPTVPSIGVVLVAVAVFARLFGDRDPWSRYMFIVGVVVLVLYWGWDWAHRLWAGPHQDDVHDGGGAPATSTGRRHDGA
jgi:hypothetical protein